MAVCRVAVEGGAEGVDGVALETETDVGVDESTERRKTAISLGRQTTSSGSSPESATNTVNARKKLLTPWLELDPESSKLAATLLLGHRTGPDMASWNEGEGENRESSMR